MDIQLKQEIVEYVTRNDPEHELIISISPAEGYTGGTIEYNTASVNLYRAISELRDEEYIRAYLLVRLVKELGYRPGREIIEFEHQYSIGRRLPDRQKARVDIILRYPGDWHEVEQRGRAFLFIECKTPDTYASDQNQIEGQIFDLARQEVPRPALGVYYTARKDGPHLLDRALVIDLGASETYSDWDSAGQPSKDILPERYGSPSRITYANVETATQNKRPLRTDVTQSEFERLRDEIHNIVWAGGGTNNNDVFVILLRLLLCRIYDELETPSHESYKFQRQERLDGSLETPDELTARMTRLFHQAAQSYLGYSREELAETIPFERRKVDPTRIAYVVAQLQDISLTRNTARGDTDLLGDFFERIVSQDFTQSKGQFFTHSNIVRFCLELADYSTLVKEVFLSRRDTQGRPRLPYIIDPSAGSGTFLVEAMKHGTNALTPLLAEALTPRQRQFGLVSFGPDSPNQWARDHIYGVEPNADLGLACKVNMILHGDGSTNIFVRSGLLAFQDYASVDRNHVLGASHITADSPYRKPKNEGFDLVLTNPPFSLDLSDEEKRELGPAFELSLSSNSETIFIERWYQLLREGGLAVAVLPESILDTPSGAEVRSYILGKFSIKAVVSLPYVTFKPFTSTKTCVVLLQKRCHDEMVTWNETLVAHQLEITKSARRNGEAIPKDEVLRLAFARTVDALEPDTHVFMAEPQNVGYKRRKGLPDLTRPNDLIGEAEAPSVLATFRAGPEQAASPRFGFWIRLSDVARRPGLRCDPKYHILWKLNGGKVFPEYPGNTTPLGGLILSAPRVKVEKGPLGSERGLVELESVEARTSTLLSVQTVDVVGSEKIEFGSADLLISKLEPYLGKVLRNDPSQNWIGSTEWLPYNVADGVDVDYVRYLLLHPGMLEAYRCLQSGKRHARFSEADFLSLQIPALPPVEQALVAAGARRQQARINRLHNLARRARATIEDSYSDRFSPPQASAEDV